MKKQSLKKALAGSLVLSTLFLQSVSAEQVSTVSNTESKNLIVLIGDGMGPAQVTAARNYLMYNKGIDHLTLDSIYTGQATTYADRGEDSGTIVSGVVTDSASAGTAFATGNKTYNAGISVSNEDVSKPFASVIEAAEAAGKATGLVSTARITHATPAVYASHVRSRDNELAIASQYLESGVDVLLGGGSSFFTSKDEGGKRTDQSLVPQFEAKGYTYITNASQLNHLSTEDQVLGLFSSSHIPYVLDRTDEIPSLAEMTKKAIDLLEKDEDGFVVMIEGGRIDHASHANDFPSTVQEVLDFDAAVKVALDYAKKNGNTSIVITADHETGGLSLSRDNIYELNLDLWDKQVHSSEYLVSRLNEAKTLTDIKKIVAANTWIKDLTDEEAQLIFDGDGSSYGREGGYNAVISKRLLVGWSGHGHSAVDVGVWAYGPITDLVKGQIDNTQIAKASAQIIGVNLAEASAALQTKYIYPKFKITRSNEVLYPAKSLAAALGATVSYDAKAGTVILKKDATSLVVNAETAEVTINGTRSDIVGEMDKGTLYLPLEAFNKLTNTTMSWDTLSERIIKK